MIIHLMLDDKFSRFVISQFAEVDSINNKFIIVSDKPTIYNIPQEDIKQVILLPTREIKPYIYSNIKLIKAIVFHGLNEEYKWDIIFELKGKVHLHWMFWGTDGYMLPHLRKGLFKPETYKLRQELLNSSKYIQYVYNSGGLTFNLYAWLYKIKTKKIHFLKKLEYAIRQVDSISAVVPQDYLRLAEKLHINTPHYPFNYGSASTLVDNINVIDTSITANNILIGNSASIENNHLDAFSCLSRFSINNRRIIVPLNYGESIPGLRNRVIEIGNSLFGHETFQPLLTFLSLEEYNSILRSCSITIMNHKKQHAMGNIISLLYHGTKLFLNKENTIFDYLSNEGFIFFDLKDLSQSHLDNPLDADAIAHNRKLILQLYDKNVVHKRTKELYEVLMRYENLNFNA